MNRTKTETKTLITNLKAEREDLRARLDDAYDHNQTHAQVVLGGQISKLTEEIERMEKFLTNLEGQ